MVRLRTKYSVRPLKMSDSVGLTSKTPGVRWEPGKSNPGSDLGILGQIFVTVYKREMEGLYRRWNQQQVKVKEETGVMTGGIPD